MITKEITSHQAGKVSRSALLIGFQELPVFHEVDKPVLPEIESLPVQEQAEVLESYLQCCVARIESRLLWIQSVLPVIESNIDRLKNSRS